MRPGSQVSGVTAVSYLALLLDEAKKKKEKNREAISAASGLIGSYTR